MTSAQIDADFLAMEKGFWTGDTAFYREHLDDACLVAFAEMAGLMDRETIAATVKDGNRWKSLKLEPKGQANPTDDTTILTYEATATRPDGRPYHAYVSTGYVKRGGAWKMMFHQQTPLA